MKKWIDFFLAKKQLSFFIYLIVGGWNTAFGVSLYALLFYFLKNTVNYMILAIIVNVFAITNAFFCYKFFVFRTKGNYLVEYIKCFIVYGSGSLGSMFFLWILVQYFSLNPVLSNFFATGVVVVGSYFGHKYFSFRKKI